MSKPRRRILFLHGMWCPPEAYCKHLAPELLKALDEGGFDVKFLKSTRPNSSDVPQWVKDLMPSIADDDHPEWYNAQTQKDGTKVLEGLFTTLGFVQEFLAKEEKPFDVIMGHSQGAQLSAILTLLGESDPSWLPRLKNEENSRLWKLAVLLNAPNPFDTEKMLSGWVEQYGKIQTPSVHVFGGKKDFTEEGGRIMKAVHFGGNCKELNHTEGHFGPQDPAKCLEIVTVVTEILEALDNK